MEYLMKNFLENKFQAKKKFSQKNFLQKISFLKKKLSQKSAEFSRLLNIFYEK